MDFRFCTIIFASKAIKLHNNNNKKSLVPTVHPENNVITWVTVLNPFLKKWFSMKKVKHIYSHVSSIVDQLQNIESISIF